jgi:large exoprotein involved in heme utilization and adhesion
LVGGPVTLSSATLSAPTGSIYLASASGVGEVPTEPRNTAAQTVRAFGPVDINAGSLVTVSDPINRGSGGSVFVTAGAMTMDAVSVVNADNFGVGTGGSVTINAGTLSISNGSSISSSTAAAGAAGTVSVLVNGQLSIDGAVSSLLHSAIFSNAFIGSSGNAGQVSVTADSLSITNGGRIGSNTIGSASGSAGTVFVTVPGQLSISGTAVPDGTPSQIASVSRALGNGAAGRVVVNAGTLSITNGGQIAASTTGNGNAGSVEVTVAGDLAIDGTGSSMPTTISTSQRVGGARGNAGQVTVNAATISLTNGGQIASSTAGIGQAGTILVNVAGQLSIDGMGLPRPLGPSNSGIGSIALPGSSGAAGQVTVKAGTLSLTNGGAILSSTAGAGAGGLVSVTTTGLASLDGVGSAIAASAEAGATGNAGSVRVSASQVTIASGGFAGN